MRLRTKLFFASSAVVLLLWAGTLWPIQRLIAANFDHVDNDNFAGTRRSLASLQAEHVTHMRQAGALVMSIPELRALIAEHNFEISSDNLASLQERLDSLAGVVGSQFICVLDSKAALISQNSTSPWRNMASLRNYVARSAQAAPFIDQLFVPRADTSGKTSADYALWEYDGRLYQVVGLPLLFSDDAAEGAHPDGALIMASAITGKLAADLAESHNCQITFLAPGNIAASSLPAAMQPDLVDAHAAGRLPARTSFDLRLGKIDYRSYLQPLIDPASGTSVGAILIQSSREAGIALQRKISLSLLAIMTGGLLLAGSVSFFISGAVTRPVGALLRGVRRVSEGDLESSIAVRQGDEIGELAAAFNEMVVQLRSRQQLQRLVDESQAATKAKSQFLANMSHEIRTPLHGVIGMANLLLASELSERQRHYAELVRSSTEVLTTLINDILDFSKIEAGKLELEFSEFDLRAVLEDVVELLAQKAFGKGVEMACHISRDVPVMVRGDANRLRQILMNLIGNAVKFTDRGEIIVRATLAETKDGGALIRFAIADTGPGMPADRMERLFKSFSQVDASTTRRYGGTGLGLAISKQLAELMGGQIGVESHVGNGSTFWFTVSLAPLDAGPRVPTTPLAGVNILILHPSPTIRDILRDELTRAGAIAQAVGTSAEAAVFVDSRPDSPPFDVAIIDRNVPDWETLSSAPSLKRLLLTTPADDLPTEKFKCLGLAASVVKPIRPAQLLGTIAAAMSNELAGQIEPRTHQPQVTQKTALKPYRILLAEDNTVNQIVASELLGSAGYDVCVVGDGRAALNAFGGGGIDLILMDCQMPVMDGLEASRAIRSVEEKSAVSGVAARRVPIVALTANASNVDRARCMEAGMDGYLQKPFRPSELLEAVTRYLEENGRRPPISTVQPAAFPANSTGPLVSAASHRGAIATATLLESSSGNVQLAGKILHRFEEQLNAALAEFAKCVESRDGESLARLAHSLKGTAGIIGAEPLRLVLVEMEQLGRCGRFDSADKDLQRLRAEIDRCAAAAAQVHAELGALTT